ncbi:MAG: tetratricopeptide repeat protein [Methanothrix sp.]|nr:tetratricopeptide repeat protein [Methanothrix sp.]MDD4447955.1 tetratricopeptide repeat protein [Methanothrix sp.]
MPRDRTPRGDDPWAIDELTDPKFSDLSSAKKISKRIFHIAKNLLAFVDLWVTILISTFRFISFLFLFLLALNVVIWLFSGVSGVTIQPFEISGLNSNLSGTSITQLLYAELYNIQEIDDKAGTMEIPSDITSGIPIDNRALPNYELLPNDISGAIGTIGVILPATGSMDIVLTNIGPIGLRDTSVGKLLLFIKSLFGESPSIITGSLQKYNSTLILLASIEDHKSSRVIPVDIRTSLTGDSSVDENIPPMVKDLAFRIAFYYLGDNMVSRNLPQNWQAFKYLIQGENAYLRYSISENIADLEESKKRAMDAIRTDRNYHKPLNLLTDLAFFLIKENGIKEAKGIFQNISSFDPVKCNIGLGLIYTKEGNYIKAIAAYDRAIQSDPNEIKKICALNGRGIALAALHNYAKAIQDYDNAIKIDSRHASLWNNKGNALEAQNKHYEAIQAYNNAIDINPNFAPAYYNIGLSLRSLGNNSAAETAFAKARDLDYK